MANPFDGRRVAAMVVLLVVLTAVLPPAAAYTLAQWRIARATETASVAAGELAARMDELRQAAGARAVLAGSGCRLPQASSAGLAWLQAPVAAGRAFEASWPQDPWGRCYLLHVPEAGRGAGGLLISAGPNGSIDTPLDAPAPAGDDIAALVR